MFPPTGARTNADSDSARHNLPAELSSFIGREREMAEVQRLLESAPTLPGSFDQTTLSAIALAVLGVALVLAIDWVARHRPPPAR